MACFRSRSDALIVALVAGFVLVGCERDVEGRGGIVTDSVYSPALYGNALGESATRAVHVYLPPDYDSDRETRYPVLYLLHAFGTGPESWFGGDDSYEGLDVRAVLDTLIQAGDVDPMIVAMPDARTRLGGSWYANSRVSGDWEAFVARDLVDHVDSTYRTTASRDARGIAGQSMGAYGAARVAIRFDAVFGSVMIMSPVFVTNPNPPGEPAMRAALAMDPTPIDRASLLARLTWSKAVAFSPDPAQPPLFAKLPYALHGDSLVRLDPVWNAWLAQGLAPLIASRPDALRAARVQVMVGDADPLFAEAHALSTALDSVHVEHDFAVFTGDHTQGVRQRFEEVVFHFFSASFSSSRND